MYEIQWNGLLISYDVVASETDGTLGPTDPMIVGIVDPLKFSDFLREEDRDEHELDQASAGIMPHRVKEWIVKDQFGDLAHEIYQDFEDEVAQALDDMQEAKREDPSW